MYVSNSQLLVDNTCNRYLINAPMLDQLKRNLDGSITLLIQHASPAAEKVSNWLPAPNGPMSIVMRAYWPRTEPPSILPVGKGAWRPPALQPAWNPAASAFAGVARAHSG